MDSTAIIIVLSILSLVVIVSFIYSSLKKNYMYKTGYLYNKVLILNQSSSIDYIRKTLTFKKRYNNKSSLDRADLNNVAIFFIEENYDEIKELVDYYDALEREYDTYHNKFTKIISENYSNNKIKLNKFYFSTYEQYKEYELLLCKKSKIKNKNEIYLHIEADYISPKGQNHWYKDHVFNIYSIKDFLTIIDNREKYKKTVQYQRDIMTDSLRYKILNRDGYKCQICGASAKEDGVKLEVDHIIPVSKGGKTIESNLQTLCERCNRGKSNRY